MAIHFHNEDVTTSFNKTTISDWLNNCIQDLDYKTGEISIIFCSDDYLLDINKKYLNHDYFTDIITFNYNEKNTIIGDLFISVDRVKENAKELKVDFNNELFRVIIHGVLHLCGYNDKTQDQQKEIRTKEDEYLALIT